MAPRCFQAAQDCPKYSLWLNTSPHGSRACKRLQDSSSIVTSGHGAPQGCAKKTKTFQPRREHTRRSPSRPFTSEELPMPQDGAGELQEGPTRGPKRAPKRPQERPRTLQQGLRGDVRGWGADQGPPLLD
eukprot:6750362-Pyramimonas_sp.AAC.1